MNEVMSHSGYMHLEN